MNDPDRAIWEGVLSHLRRKHPGLCRQWFDSLEPVCLDAGVMHVRTTTTIHRDYLQRQCGAAFNDSIQAVSGRLIGVRFIGPLDEAPRRVGSDASSDRARSAASAGTPGRTRQAKPAQSAGPGRTDVVTPPKPRHYREDGVVINPDYGFENFVVGPGNRLAHAAARAIAAGSGAAYNPLFIHGGVGLGKTHLLQAICIELYEKQPETAILYTSCDGFLRQFMDAVQSGEMARFEDRFYSVDLLIVDDIHFLARNETSQEGFFHTFNALHHAGKQIVLSSDARPEHIQRLEDRLVSRFNSGLVAEIEPPDFETRVQILRKKAELRSFPIPDEVAFFIAEHADRNIRELEGALTKIQIQASVDGKPPSIELAQSALGASARAPSVITVQQIMEVVSEYYNVRIADILSRRRPRSIALPRQICMYIARRATRHSLEEIGAYFGGRDHTTVMHAVRTVAERRAIDSDFDACVAAIEARLFRNPQPR
jgi:chromosomal replication initiator protein